ncbi:hypothetical protein CGLO_08194 [Colletotrichum gloeosporioides Cg-14]|uniref:Uncharacterized protein n=1 Tax=Colletotrichum gloeosporioides (strain Cg-14) TaxID=1237896 RepID=T0LV51_COLGC|nr:hypothetical protein CGLO_08194 [Colletotrichum gloeosporioides Cg-14]
MAAFIAKFTASLFSTGSFAL